MQALAVMQTVLFRASGHTSESLQCPKRSEYPNAWRTAVKRSAFPTLRRHFAAFEYNDSNGKALFSHHLLELRRTSYVIEYAIDID